MIASFDFSSFSNDEILSFKTLTITPDELFVTSLAFFPAIIVSSSKQSLLSTSARNFLKLFISFNMLSWFTFVSSCVGYSTLVSSRIIFSVNKLLFALLQISCVSGTRILSGSSAIIYALDTPHPLSCNILSITILSKIC